MMVNLKEVHEGIQIYHPAGPGSGRIHLLAIKDHVLVAVDPVSLGHIRHKGLPPSWQTLQYLMMVLQTFWITLKWAPRPRVMGTSLAEMLTRPRFRLLVHAGQVKAPSSISLPSGENRRALGILVIWMT